MIVLACFCTLTLLAAFTCIFSFDWTGDLFLFRRWTSPETCALHRRSRRLSKRGQNKRSLYICLVNEVTRNSEYLNGCDPVYLTYTLTHLPSTCITEVDSAECSPATSSLWYSSSFDEPLLLHRLKTATVSSFQDTVGFPSQSLESSSS